MVTKTKPHLNGSQARLAANDAGFTRRMRELTLNAASMREEWMRRALEVNPNRDLYHECGYPQEISKADYKAMFDREIGCRVVGLYPNECWAMEPEVYEKEEEDDVTAFEEALADVGRRLQGDSWHEEPKGNFLYSYLKQVDVLSGIGHFGVLLLGIRDGKKLDEPAEGLDEHGMMPKRKNKGKKKEKEDLTDNEVNPKPKTDEEPTAEVPTDLKELLFIRAFDETLVEIDKYEEDMTNPRFGKPVMYSIKMADPSAYATDTSNSATTDVKVHWTRIIHVLDNKESSEVFGTPRQKQVWNRLVDLRKIYGGSAEMFWKGGFPGISFETDPKIVDAEMDVESLKLQMTDYQNGLQRYLALQGMTAKTLEPQVADPKSHIAKQLEAIAITIGCPTRIFMGTEEGRLASSQDMRTWNKRLAQRQVQQVTPNIIRPTIDRLIALGVLPEPEQYFVHWPDLNAPTDDDKASTAQKTTDAMRAYLEGQVDALMAPLDYLVHVQKFTRQEAEVILEAAKKRITEEGEDDPILARQAEQKEMEQEQFDRQMADQEQQTKVKGTAVKVKAKVQKKADAKRKPRTE